MQTIVYTTVKEHFGCFDCYKFELIKSCSQLKETDTNILPTIRNLSVSYANCFPMQNYAT